MRLPGRTWGKKWQEKDQAFCRNEARTGKEKKKKKLFGYKSYLPVQTTNSLKVALGCY